MGRLMLDIYLYKLDKMTKEAMADISMLKMEISTQHSLPPEAITMHLKGKHGGPELRFDVSVLDYETKHAVDLSIRKVLKKNHIKFTQSNASNPKINFYYGQTVMSR